MRIIIVGAGTVGSALAENLSSEDHDITLIDKDASRLQALHNRLDIRTVQGNGSYPAVLRAAGAESADMLIAVTNIDEVNMVACQVAYSLFHTPKKVARVRSAHYFIRKELFGDANLPIDKFINPERLLIKYVKQLIAYPGALQVVEFSGGKVKLVTVKLVYSAPVIGKPCAKLKEYLPDIEMKVVAIFRGEKSIKIQDDTVFEVGDEVFLIAEKKFIKPLVEMMTRIEKEYKSVLIGGGSALGLGLAKNLEENYQVKIIDYDAEQCKMLSQTLQKTVVLLGDVNDKELLMSEDIENIDVYIAVTNNDESNIMSGMLARRLGVKQVMALVQRADYADLVEDSGITLALSPKLITTSWILAYVRGKTVAGIYSLRRGAAEALEAVVKENNHQVIGRKISALHLSAETVIGAIVRDNEVIIPDNETSIMANDHVIVFVANKSEIKSVEKLFQIEEKES